MEPFVQYKDPTGERNAGELRALAARGTLAITGPDRSSWLNGVVTADLAQLPTKAAYGLALNRTGKIQSDVICLQTGSKLLVSIALGAFHALTQEWDRMLIMEDAELSDESNDWDWYQLIGTTAEPAVFPEDSVVGALDLLGVGGYCAAVPRAQTWSPAVIDDAHWLALRLERGFPEFGTDYGSDERPHEAALDRRAVSWTKGCYLGQEVVCMQEMRGKVKRRLRVLRAGSFLDPLPVSGSNVVDSAGKVVGQVTSSANSTRLGVGLVMAKLSVAAEKEALFLVDVEEAASLTALDGIE